MLSVVQSWSRYSAFRRFMFIVMVVSFAVTMVFFPIYCEAFVVSSAIVAITCGLLVGGAAAIGASLFAQGMEEIADFDIEYWLHHNDPFTVDASNQNHFSLKADFDYGDYPYAEEICMKLVSAYNKAVDDGVLTTYNLYELMNADFGEGMHYSWQSEYQVFIDYCVAEGLGVEAGKIVRDNITGVRSFSQNEVTSASVCDNPVILLNQTNSYSCSDIYSMCDEATGKSPVYNLYGNCYCLTPFFISENKIYFVFSTSSTAGGSSMHIMQYRVRATDNNVFYSDLSGYLSSRYSFIDVYRHTFLFSDLTGDVQCGFMISDLYLYSYNSFNSNTFFRWFDSLKTKYCSLITTTQEPVNLVVPFTPAEAAVQGAINDDDDRLTDNPVVSFIPTVDTNGNVTGTTTTVDDVSVKELEEEAIRKKLDIDLESIDVWDKFPFCLPFDLYRLISIFEYPEKKPVIIMPIEAKLENKAFEYNIDEEVVLDLTTVWVIGEADMLKIIANTVMLISWTLGLILVTNKLIKH